MQDRDEYEVVIGLEVHAQLLTRTKLFCGDTTYFGREPNTQVSIISLAHPGTLPRMNKEVISLALRLGLATNCTIVTNNYFARKNYFYPDLPKGYQISQHTTPICRNGWLEVNSGDKPKKIRINRIHMEEDAGKSLHDREGLYSNLDFNRAGMPLVEIVTEPDIRSAEEAFTYVSNLRKLVRHLGVCDGNMEEGSLRCDVNISVRPRGEEKLGTRVEIKNLNSIRFIKKAIEYESQRLIGLHQSGKTIVQETRGFDEEGFVTYSIRTKEDEDDYRYFPEPDLPPFLITEEMIQAVKDSMPALPSAIKEQLSKEYSLTDYNAEQIAADTELSQVFFKLAQKTKNYKSAANWVIGPVRNLLAAGEDLSAGLPTDKIALIIEMVDEGRVNHGTAVQILFPELVKDPSIDPVQYVSSNHLYISDNQDEINSLIEAALDKHSQKITEYKKGKKGLISLFVGEVMKLSGGKADARMVTEKIIEKLKHS